MLWKCQPSTLTTSPLGADVDTDRRRQPIVRIGILKRQHTDPAEFQNEYQRTLEQIQKYVNWINSDVAGLNRQLPDYITEQFRLAARDWRGMRG